MLSKNSEKLYSDMQIISIQNTDLTNLENCESEPIHIPGSIQPHGFLLGLNKDTFVIEYCSGNTENYLNVSYKEILGKDFKAVFLENNFTVFKNYIDKLNSDSSFFRISYNEAAFLCTAHYSGENIIVECEPDVSENPGNFDMFLQSREFISYMEETNSLQKLCDLVSKGIRKSTGYDRVMIYRFDKDYNGEVFAESKRDDLEPFLGLHYPHTDIPAQARLLYTKNLLRQIVDINYTPVPIYTFKHPESDSLDLSLSFLRSTSPIHVEYLQNMGVGATLTISLIHKGKLWGLVACHHYSPKNISPETRLSAKLHGHFITSQIDVRQSYEEYETTKKVNATLDELLSLKLEPEYSSLKTLIVHPALLNICNASGVSIKLGSLLLKNGDVPENSCIEKFSGWLANNISAGSFHSNEIKNDLPGDIVSEIKLPGIFAIRLNLQNTDCIIWYRNETHTEINWAGDPTKAILHNDKGLSPRNSFKLWKQLVTGTSREWLLPEMTAASTFVNFFQQHITSIIQSEDEKNQKKLVEALKETNSELENITWIGTHDLQEPLRKIQLASSQILTVKDENIPDTFFDKVEKMSVSAKKMQNLIKDILNYSKTISFSENMKEVDLNSLLEVVLSDISNAASQNVMKFEIPKLPSVNGIPFLLKQLFTNLITNSIKFARKDGDPVLTIRAEVEYLDTPSLRGNFNKIIFLDNGIGFESRNNEDIFNVFKRLHSSSNYEGSGIGLAICKKIMKTHQGMITAEGHPNVGATFNLYFPVSENLK